MHTLPREVWREILSHLPTGSLVNARLLSKQAKALSDIVLTQPRMVLQVISMGLSEEQLISFLAYYRSSQADKKLRRQSFKHLNSTEALCRALTINNANSDEKLCELLSNLKPKFEFTEPETFLRLLDTLFWPDLGGEAQRIRELICYYRTTPAFERLQAMDPNQMNEYELMCYALTTTHVEQLPLVQLQTILQARNERTSIENSGFKHCLKSLNLTMRMMTNKNHLLEIVQERPADEKFFFNLAGIQLENITLKDANLSGANLEGANLSGSIWQNVALTGANLQSVDMTHVKIEGSQDNIIDMTKADLRNVVWGTNSLTHMNLTDTWLLSDISELSLKQFPSNYAVLEALVNDVIRLVNTEIDPNIALEKINLAIEFLPLMEFPNYLDLLEDEKKFLSKHIEAKELR